MKQYVNGLTEGERFESVVVLRSKEMRIARTGDPYLALEFADRTGQVPGVYFRPTRESADVPVGAMCSVRGRVTAYRGSRRIAVDSLAPAEEWDSEDLMARGVRPEKELVAELKDLVASVREPGLRRVLRAVFGDERFFRTFRRCPGSQSYHHAYVGGLLEHTVTVAALCSGLAERYALIDRDLLVTAALLHDIGKATTTVFIEGRWRAHGHAEVGAENVPAIMARIGYPELAEDVAWLVRHHLFHFSWHLRENDRLTRNQLRFMEHPLFPFLLHVCIADAAGSRGGDKENKIMRIADIYEEEVSRTDLHYP